MRSKIIDVITIDACAYFGLDEDSVFHLKVEYGIKYLDHRYANDLAVGNALKQHAEFWHWWRELWAQRDLMLMKRCAKKYYGFNYSYPLNTYMGTQPMMETSRVFHYEVWEFYTDMHYWTKVKLYPNPVLVSACIHEDQFVTIKQL